MRIYDAFNRGDGATVAEAADAAVSIEDHGVIDGKTYHGRRGVKEFLAFQGESFRGQRAQFQDMIEAEDTLVIVVRPVGRGRVERCARRDRVHARVGVPGRQGVATADLPEQERGPPSLGVED